jgi:hypothetical protein
MLFHWNIMGSYTFSGKNFKNMIKCHLICSKKCKNKMKIISNILKLPYFEIEKENLFLWIIFKTPG